MRTADADYSKKAFAAPSGENILSTGEGGGELSCRRYFGGK